MADEKDQPEVNDSPPPSRPESPISDQAKPARYDLRTAGSGIEHLAGDLERPGRRSRFSPPRRRGSVGTWAVLLGCLLLALPALIVQLNVGDVVDADEARTIATSVHAWQRLHDPDKPDRFQTDRYAPFLNGQERFDILPGTTWTHFAGLAVARLGGEADSIDTLVLRTRSVSVVCALLVIAAVFWTGYAIGGIKTGAFSALICASLPIVLWHGRIASTPIVHSAWAMLAIAAAVWAIRPLRPAPSVERQFIGWLLCGLAIGAALLTVGLIGLLTTIVPIVLLLVMCPGRTSHMLGLLAASLIALLLILPWALFAHDHDPEAWGHWLAPFDQPFALSLPGLGEQIVSRFGLLLLALLPWTLWLIGAFVQPFSTSSVGVRTRMFLGWAWFIYMGLLFLLLPVESGVGAALPVLPVTAVLIGQLFRQYSDLAAEGRYARFWRWLRWPHLAVLLFVSGLVPAAIYAQPWLLENTTLSRPVFGSMPDWFIVGLIGVLMLVLGLSIHWMNRQHPGLVVASWSVWVLGLMTTLLLPISQGDWLQNPMRYDAAWLNAHTDDAPTYWLVEPSDASNRIEPDPFLMLYGDRPFKTIATSQLHHVDDEVESFYYVVGPTRPGNPPDASLTEMAELADSGLTLWRYGPRAKSARTAP